MPQSSQSNFQLYDYRKLNTNSLFQRLVTDVEGKHLHDWFLDADEKPSEAWRWIQT